MVRRYKLKERARAQEETRARIVKATVALHESVGLRATTISAIAERAGVERLTVYRHFPNEAALLKACSSHWFAQNPAPDPSQWEIISVPRERVREALVRLYGYFRGARRMLTSVYRDEPFLTIKSPLEPFREYLNGVADTLSKQYGKASTRGGVAATLRHAVQFETWRSFAELGLSDTATVDLVASWIDGLASSASRAARSA